MPQYSVGVSSSSSPSPHREDRPGDSLQASKRRHDLAWKTALQGYEPNARVELREVLTSPARRRVIINWYHTLTRRYGLEDPPPEASGAYSAHAWRYFRSGLPFAAAAHFHGLTRHREPRGWQWMHRMPKSRSELRHNVETALSMLEEAGVGIVFTREEFMTWPEQDADSLMLQAHAVWLKLASAPRIAGGGLTRSPQDLFLGVDARRGGRGEEGVRWEQPSMRLREAHLVVTVSLDDEGPEHDETMSPVSVPEVGGWVGSAVESKVGKGSANPNSSSSSNSSSNHKQKKKSDRNDGKNATENKALHHGVPKLRLPSSSLPSSNSVGARPSRGCWCGGAADAGTVSVAASIQALARQLELRQQHGMVDGGMEDHVEGYSPAEKAAKGVQGSLMMVSSSSSGRHGGGEVDENNASAGWGSGGAAPSSSARAMPERSPPASSSSSSSASTSGSRGDAATGETREPLITFDDDDFNTGQVGQAATASLPAPSEKSSNGNNNSSNNNSGFQSSGRLTTSAGGYAAESASVSMISFEEGEEAVGERSCIVGDDDGDSDDEGAQLLSPERGGERRWAGGTLLERDEELREGHVEEGAEVDLAGALGLALSPSADGEHDENRQWAMLGLLLCYRGATGPGWSGDSIVTRLRASFSQGLGTKAVAVLTTWLTDAPRDFEDLGMRDALDAFIHPAPGSPPDWRGMEEARERLKRDCEQWLTSLTGIRSYLEESIAALVIAGEGGDAIGSDAADHLCLDVGEIASYLTVRESCMFVSIEYADLISPNPRGARAVASIEESHEEQAQWVKRCVCGAAKAKHQARLISHFLDIADACMALGNMPSTLAIWQGLQSEAVRSLQDANARALGKARTISVYGVVGQQCARLLADGLAGKKPGEHYVPFIGGAMDRIERCHMGAALFVGEGMRERINMQVAANIAMVAVPCIMRHQHSRYPPQFSQSVASYMQAQLGTGAISHSVEAIRRPTRTEPRSPAIPTRTPQGPQGRKMPAW